jgi:hypothetical protein
MSEKPKASALLGYEYYCKRLYKAVTLLSRNNVQFITATHLVQQWLAVWLLLLAAVWSSAARMPYKASTVFSTATQYLLVEAVLLSTML